MAPTLANRTREQLRQSVGDNLPDFFLGTTTSAPGDSTSVIDTSAWGGSDIWKGHWIRFYDGTLDGEVRRVSAFSTGDHTVDPAFTTNVPNAASYERWHPEFEPLRIDRFIQDAILDTYGRSYDEISSLALHTGGGSTTTSSASSSLLRTGGDSRFDVPAGLSVIRQIEYRSGVSSQELHACERVFDESVDADFTVTVDTTRKRRGNSSVKFVVAGTVSAGDLVSDSIASIDISDKTHVEMWVYCSTAVAANDLVFALDDTANAVSPLESLAYPAIAADTWTFVRLALTVPEDLTDIISIALVYNANAGANTIWLDDIQAIDEDTSIWDPLSRRAWSLEKGTSDLLITEVGRIDLGYTLLKLIGGGAPLVLAADTDVNEVDDLFVIYKATELAFESRASIKAEYARQAGIFRLRAEERRKSLSRLRGSRQVA